MLNRLRSRLDTSIRGARREFQGLTLVISGAEHILHLGTITTDITRRETQLMRSRLHLKTIGRRIKFLVFLSRIIGSESK